MECVVVAGCWKVVLEEKDWGKIKKTKTTTAIGVCGVRGLSRRVRPALAVLGPALTSYMICKLECS